MDEDPGVIFGSDGCVDPYIDPETGVLRNLLDALTDEDLKEIEAQAVLIRFEDAIDYLTGVDELTFEVWKDVHCILFSDVYEWAGTVRTVMLGIPDTKINFNTPPQIDGECRQLIADACACTDFFDQLGGFYAKLNFQHPFREGNGRSLKCFFAALAFRHGLFLDWNRVTSEAFTEALATWQKTYDDSEAQAILSNCARSVSPGDDLRTAILSLGTADCFTRWPSPP